MKSVVWSVTWYVSHRVAWLVLSSSWEGGGGGGGVAVIQTTGLAGGLTGVSLINLLRRHSASGDRASDSGLRGYRGFSGIVVL